MDYSDFDKGGSMSLDQRVTASRDPTQGLLLPRPCTLAQRPGLNQCTVTLLGQSDTHLLQRIDATVLRLQKRVWPPTNLDWAFTGQESVLILSSCLHICLICLDAKDKIVWLQASDDVVVFVRQV